MTGIVNPSPGNRGKTPGTSAYSRFLSSASRFRRLLKRGVKWSPLRIIGLTGIIFLARPGGAETIEYSIYSLPVFFGEPELIDQGTLSYSIDDVAVAAGPIDNLDDRVRTIWITPSFSVSSTSHPKEEINGFGLWLSKDGGGFSWEWFRRINEDEFDKLQGPGKVRVTLVNRNGLKELGSVEVIETITLRVNTLRWLRIRDGDTHRVIVEAGSKLLFAEQE